MCRSIGQQQYGTPQSAATNAVACHTPAKCSLACSFHFPLAGEFHALLIVFLGDKALHLYVFVSRGTALQLKHCNDKHQASLKCRQIESPAELLDVCCFRASQRMHQSSSPGRVLSRFSPMTEALSKVYYIGS